MASPVFDAKGTPLDRQRTTWRDMVRKPIGKLDDERRHLALVHGWYHAAIGLMPVPGMLPPGGSAALPTDATRAPTATPDVTTPPAGLEGMRGADI